ncbi:MAG: flagellar protein FlgN [Desulfobacterales bacterium]|nr:flagellar protein FlgN [Desulfobacterales bacterium]
MELLLKELKHCILEQQRMYQSLLDLFTAERSAILISDVERLNRIVGDKERLLQDIGKVEVKRHHITEQLAKHLHADGPGVNLSCLCSLIEEPWATELASAGRELNSLVAAIQTASERNRSLCLHALQFVNGSIRMITNLIDPDLVYHPSGKLGHERPVGRMLSGAA